MNSTQPSNGQSWISTLQGRMIFDQTSGKFLGRAQEFYINPKTKKVSAVDLKKSFFSRRKFVHSSDIVLVGEDILMVKNKGSAFPIDKLNKNKNRSFKEMKNLWVTTLNGVHAGKLNDIKIENKSFLVSEALLDTGLKIKFQSKDLMFGKDEVLIPVQYEPLLTSEAASRNKNAKNVTKKILNKLGKNFSEKEKKPILKKRHAPQT